MKKLSFTLIIAGTIFAGKVSAQFSCGTDAIVNKSLQEHPELVQEQQQLEEFTQSFRMSNEQTQAPIFTIPVVFHIIHEYGPENISDAQILDEMRILNEDYQKLNADISQVVAAFQGITADAQIQFKLARKDPNGNCTTGIDRVVSPLTYAADDNSKLNPWPRNKYLNVWVVSSIGTAGVAGYAYLPGTAPNSNVDGVLILSGYIGSIGTGSPSTSRALTHEIGHFFNLKHTWGNTNNPGVACGDDNVTDTPVTKGWTSCNLTTNDVCNANVQENVQNFMEYSYCSKMFTNGQKTRMQAALNSSTAGRNNLSAAANLTATGVNTNPTCAPVADFISTTTSVCAGGTITYKWQSNQGHPTSWNWSFPGGTPSTSTDSFPVITYNTPGTYSVTMTVSNSGGTNSLTKTSYVTVYPNTATYNAWQYVESFEFTSSLPNADWIVSNPSGFGWVLTSTAAYMGANSAKLSNDANQYGNVDELSGPTIDFSQINNPVFTFKVAFAQRTTSDADVLKVFASADCGRTWIQRYMKTSSALKTVSSPVTGTFTPTSSSQWRTETVGIAPYVTLPEMRIKFQFTSGGGNNIYIDDINIVGASTVDEIGNNINLNIYPNPATESTLISFNLLSNEKMNISVTDLLGRTVQKVFEGNLDQGYHEYTLNTSGLEAGIYFVKVEVGDHTVTQKIVVQ